ncbi:hypothetical protein AADG42_11650 [Ammonicoccus fulvus]|uniref:DUF4878 domain-containing protein n=1 Tax=Ammonicoccus fulvus TaxID=3138240 RepID=A0ABZ3FPE6_9ACTN
MSQPPGYPGATPDNPHGGRPNDPWGSGDPQGPGSQPSAPGSQNSASGWPGPESQSSAGNQPPPAESQSSSGGWSWESAGSAGSAGSANWSGEATQAFPPGGRFQGQQGPGGPGGPGPHTGNQPTQQQPWTPRQQPNQPYPTQQQPAFGSQPPRSSESLGPGTGSTPVQPEGNRPERNPKKLALIIGAAALALVLIIVGAVLIRNYQTQVAEERAAEAARVAEEQRQAEQGRQETAARTTVEEYFGAIATADAEKALTYAAAEPEGNNDLLSRDVLLEANKRAAYGPATIDSVTLDEESPGVWNTGKVTTSYAIGDQPQNVEIPLRKVGADWKLDAVAAPVQLGLSGPDRLVNGVTVRPGDYNMFPGSYSVTSPNPLVTFATTEFVLASPVDSVTGWEPEPVLSDEGRKQTVDAAKRAVDECMKAKELQPPNCPFIRWVEENNLVIDKPSIRYTLKNDPFRDVQFRFYAGTMTASTTVTIEHEIRASATQNGNRGTLVPATQSNPAFVTVKLAEGTPQVSFS